jgi:hypothetical protein
MTTPDTLLDTNCSLSPQVARASWCFLIFKLSDFFETAILVLGKRHELITPYHIAHHFLMPK